MSKLVSIYKITSPSGRVYIGQSWNTPSRWATHRVGKNQRQPKLYASFQKYGVESHVFEELIGFPFGATQADLDRHEQMFMDQYRARGVDLLNVKEAGSRGRISEETKRKIGAAFKGRVISEEHRRKISLKNKGRKRSEETRRLIGAVQKGKKKPPHSVEQNEKQRQRMLGSHPSEETRRKQSAWQIGLKRPHIAESNHRRALRGELFNNYVRPKGKDNPRFGMKHSPESLAKMSRSHKGFVVTDQQKAKVSLRVRGEGNAAALLTEAQVLEIRAKYKPYIYQQKQLAEEYSVSRATICGIVGGRLWKHLLQNNHEWSNAA